MKQLTLTINTKAAFLLVLIIALLLRLYNLNYEGLWNDELFTADTANPRHSVKRIIELLTNDIHPPLHNLLMHFWSKLFSYGDTPMRVFNVLLGVWGIVSVRHLGKLLFNNRVAWIAVLLATVNFLLIKYSQEVRAYALMFLLGNYSVYFFVRLARDGFKLWNGVAYILITTGLLYTHYFGFFVVAGQYAFFLVIANWREIKKHFWKYLIAAITPLFLFFYFWLPSLKVHLNRKTRGWRDDPEWTMIFSYPEEFFNDLILSKLSVVLLLVSGLYLIIRKFLPIKKIEKLIGPVSRSIAILVIWAVVYFLLPYIKSSFSTSMMVPKYFMGMLAPFILILAYTLSLIPKKLIRNGIVATIIGYCVLILFLNDRPYYTQTTSYREIAQEAKNLEPGAPVVYLSNHGRYFRYYLGQNGFRRIRPKFEQMQKIIERDDPHRYFVFLDLRLTPKAYKEGVPVIEGYAERNEQTFYNKAGMKTVSLLTYEKIEQSP